MNNYFSGHEQDDVFYEAWDRYDRAHDPDQKTAEQARASAALCDEARIKRRHAAEALILRRAMGLRS